MKHANLFVDEVEIEVRSGKGGDGIVAFRREKFVSQGGPNGGDGGRGGDIVLVADDNVGTLLDFKGAKKIKAANGQNGGGSDKKGASGTHVEVRVPVGTLVFDLGEPAEPGVDDDFEGFEDEGEGSADEAKPAPVDLNEHAALADLTESGQRVVVARGGRGGLGNARFKTSTRQALVPSLGVVERDDQRIVVADIPGLIEGASDGAGLGHQFLRHVERTRVLIHLLDLEAMLTLGRDLVDDYDAIRRELGRYRPELLDRKEIVVLSKSDLVHDDALVADLEAKLAARGIRGRRISAAATQGLDGLLHEVFDAVEAERALEKEHEQEGAAR